MWRHPAAVRSACRSETLAGLDWGSGAGGPTVQARENGHRRIETSTIDTLDLARGQLPFADARQALPVIGERCVVKHGRETASVESCITSVGAEAAQPERGEARHGVWRG